MPLFPWRSILRCARRRARDMMATPCRGVTNGTLIGEAGWYEPSRGRRHRESTRIPRRSLPARAVPDVRFRRHGLGPVRACAAAPRPTWPCKATRWCRRGVRRPAPQSCGWRTPRGPARGGWPGRRLRRPAPAPGRDGRRPTPARRAVHERGEGRLVAASGEPCKGSASVCLRSSFSRRSDSSPNFVST